jgi:hypothetical protein
VIAMSASYIVSVPTPSDRLQYWVILRRKSDARWPQSELDDSPNTVDSRRAPERDVLPRNASIAIDAPTSQKGYMKNFNGVCRYLKVE